MPSKEHIGQYVFPPFKHQAVELRDHLQDEARAIFWEQGTGKTKAEIDRFADLLRNGDLSGLVVVAPPGVDRNWIKIEWPAHAPPDLVGEVQLFLWSTKRKKTKGYQQELAAFLDKVRKGAPFLFAASYDAMLTTECADAMRELLTDYPCLLGFDESARIKNPKALRAKTAVAASNLAKYKTVLSGTPILGKPFDVFMQVMAIDVNFWYRKGIGRPNGRAIQSSHHAFKQKFGVWRTNFGPGGRTFQELQGYQNLHILEEWLSEIATRVEKKDALDLPPKLYKRMTYELPPKQRALYDELKAQYIVELEAQERAKEEGQRISVVADLAIVRMLRLQQIVCGYLPDEDGNVMDICGGDNPRLELLKEIVEDIEGKVIIWARFTEDLNSICRYLTEEFGDDSWVRYDGTVTDENVRGEAVDRFQKGNAKFFVANAQTAGEGLTLHAAKTVIYYSNSFKLGERLQSEDRAHRAGMTPEPVLYIDLEAEETIDAHIVANLQAKKEIADRILNSKLKAWLQAA